MSISFQHFEEIHCDAVRRFNQRIGGAAGAELTFPERPRVGWLSEGGHPDLFQEPYLALEGDEVRGGYILKHQNFWLNGAVRRVSCYRLPLSEGVANRAYVSLGLQLQRHALARQPYQFSLGMGALERPIARMQKALGFSQCAIPFHFRVLRGGPFLRNIRPLRTSGARRALFDLAALTGAASLASSVWKAFHPIRGAAGVSTEPFTEFGPWADELWAETRDRYALIAVRDRDTGNTLYPPGSQRFLRWKVTDGDRLLGWAVCLDTRMQNHKQFGNMRVATIVDTLAGPADAAALLAAVTRELERCGADLIISNQMHAVWSEGLAAAGFRSGPSNYFLSASPKLAEALSPFAVRVKEAHINRADGDGPIHL